MKVRMKVAISGTRNGSDWPPIGGDIDVTKAEAEHLITAGYAEAVDEPAPKKPEPEKATARKPSTRKG